MVSKLVWNFPLSIEFVASSWLRAKELDLLVRVLFLVRKSSCLLTVSNVSEVDMMADAGRVSAQLVHEYV